MTFNNFEKCGRHKFLENTRFRNEEKKSIVKNFSHFLTNYFIWSRFIPLYKNNSAIG